jgi:membrane protease subunit (stomatin/prohibitin family)
LPGDLTYSAPLGLQQRNLFSLWKCQISDSHLSSPTAASNLREAKTLCGGCGADVGTAKFCPECGKSVERTVEPKFCPECGAKSGA